MGIYTPKAHKVDIKLFVKPNKTSLISLSALWFEFGHLFSINSGRRSSHFVRMIPN